MSENDQHLSDGPGGEPGSEDTAQVWALTPAQLVGHWAVIAALFAVGVGFPVWVLNQYFHDVDGVVGWGVAVFGGVVAIGFAYGVVSLAVGQLRAGTAVWIDSRDHAVAVFRATGRALHTTPDRVQRIDRGAGRRDPRSPHSPLSGYPPLRIVASDGTVHLSVLLGPPTEIAYALSAHNPRIHLEL